MVLHTCTICSKDFARKNDLERHQNKKNKCIPKSIEHNIPNIELHQNTTQSTNNPPTVPPLSTNNITMKNIDYNNHNKCIQCNKTFTRTDSYNRHILFRCKNYDKPIIKDNNKDVIDLLLKIDEKHSQERKETDKKIEELQNTIIELQSKINTEPVNITNNTTNNTINNTTNNTVNINNNTVYIFGSKIDHSLIPTEKLLKILYQGAEKTVPLMVEEIHCNFRYPQHHNIYVSDKRSNEAIIFDGEKYKTIFIDEAINDLDRRMKVHMSDRFNKIDKSEFTHDL
jgi:hypothetical protein